MGKTTRAFVAGLLWLPLPAVGQAPPVGDGGPYHHQVLSATSADGATFGHDGQVLLEHASVPAAIRLADGRIRLYYVDASSRPENVNCAESWDEGRSFTVLGCTIANRGGAKAVDPAIVQLPDGRFRLYYYASAEGDPGTASMHAIHAAISDDGVGFVDEGSVFEHPGLVDPDVFWTGREWLMYVFSLTDRATVVATSRDGLSFRYVGPASLQFWGTTAAHAIGDGRLRMYAFEQKTQKSVGSFVSWDGLAWEQEPGTRLEAETGYQVTDPFVVPLADGRARMFYKRSRDAR